MMFTFQSRIPAGSARFTPGVASQLVGQTTKVSTPSGSQEGVIVAAEVIEDGAAALITISVEEGSPAHQLISQPGIEEHR